MEVVFALESLKFKAAKADPGNHKRYVQIMNTNVEQKSNSR